MKTISKISVLVALLLVTATGLANEPKLNLIPGADAKSLVFQLDGQSGKTTIQITDTKNNLIYSEVLKREGVYSKKFDLKKLETGVYFMNVENSLKVVEYTLDVKDTAVEILDRKESSKPVFRTKGDIVYLNLLNLEQKDVNIKVYDSSYRLVYSETLKDTLLVEKAFNFESAVKDSYTVVVKDKYNSYYKDIIVD